MGHKPFIGSVNDLTRYKQTGEFSTLIPHGNRRLTSAAARHTTMAHQAAQPRELQFAPAAIEAANFYRAAMANQDAQEKLMQFFQDQADDRYAGRLRQAFSGIEKLAGGQTHVSGDKSQDLLQLCGLPGLLNQLGKITKGRPITASIDAVMKALTDSRLAGYCGEALNPPVKGQQRR